MIMKILRLDEKDHKQDLELLRTTIKNILKGTVPNEYELQVEYGDAEHSKIWNLKMIKDWLKADEETQRDHTLTIEQRFAKFWNKTIDSIVKNRVNEWKKTYVQHVVNDLHVSWTTSIEQGINLMVKEWLKKAKKHPIMIEHLENDLTNLCDAVLN